MFKLLSISVIIIIVCCCISSFERIESIDLYSHLTRSELVNRIAKCESALDVATTGKQECDMVLGTVELQLQRLKSNTIALGPGRNYNLENTFQQIGFIYNSDNRYPLYGQRYPGKRDKWEYYVVDESRNKLRIKVKSVGDNELYTGDTLSVPILSSTPFAIELYEYDNFKYNPW